MNQLIPVGHDAMMIVSQSLASSGYFQDAKAASQAYVKVLAGAELGIPPFQAMSGIHVINGKPQLGAGIIASLIKSSGKYNYKVVEQSETVCSLDFYEGSENIGNSRFTIEMARKAQVKNLDKYPQNMLFARAISNGAKWYTPDIFGGAVYADGELEPLPSSVEDSSHEVIYEAQITDAQPADAHAQPAYQAEVPKGKKATADFAKALTDWQNGLVDLQTFEQVENHRQALIDLKMGENDVRVNFKALKSRAKDLGYTWDKVKTVFVPFDAETGEVLTQTAEVVNG